MLIAVLFSMFSRLWSRSFGFVMGSSSKFLLWLIFKGDDVGVNILSVQSDIDLFKSNGGGAFIFRYIYS